MRIIIDKKEIQLNTYKTFKNKLIGLMFKKSPIKEGYFFKNCNNIHTFFMKQNIDICMIDKDYNIIYLKENVPKKKIIIKLKAKHTIELPLNTVKYLKINSKLKIEE